MKFNNEFKRLTEAIRVSVDPELRDTVKAARLMYIKRGVEGKSFEQWLGSDPNGMLFLHRIIAKIQRRRPSMSSDRAEQIHAQMRRDDVQMPPLAASGGTPPNFESTFNSTVKHLCESLSDQPLFVHERSNAYNKFYRIKNAILTSSSVMEIQLENGQTFPLSLTRPSHNYKLILNDGTLTDAQTVARIFGLLQPDQIVTEGLKVPTWGKVRKVLAKRGNEGNYLYEKDPETWDEYDLSNWHSLLRKYGFDPGAQTKFGKWKKGIAQSHKEKGHRTKKMMTKIDPVWFKLGLDPEKAAAAAHKKALAPVVHSKFDAKDLERIDHITAMLMDYLHGNKLFSWDPKTPGYTTWYGWVKKHYNNMLKKMTDEEILTRFKIVPESVVTEYRLIIEKGDWENFPYRIEAKKNGKVVDSRTYNNYQEFENKHRPWVEQRQREGCTFEKKQLPRPSLHEKVDFKKLKAVKSGKYKFQYKPMQKKASVSKATKGTYKPSSKNEYYFGTDQGTHTVSWEHTPDAVFHPKMKFDDEEEAKRFARYLKKKEPTYKDIKVEKLNHPSVDYDDFWCERCGEPIGAEHSPYCRYKGIVDGENEEINWDNVSRDMTPSERTLNKGLDKMVNWIERIFPAEA